MGLAGRSRAPQHQGFALGQEVGQQLGVVVIETIVGFSGGDEIAGDQV